MTAGYSGTPLAKKLGYREGSRAYLENAPDGYADVVRPLPGGVTFAAEPGAGVGADPDFGHPLRPGRPRSGRTPSR